MKIPAGKFKAECLKLMDKVEAQKVEVIITKHGRPVARLLPIENGTKSLKTVFGFMRGAGEIKGDIISPLSDEKWDVDGS